MTDLMNKMTFMQSVALVGDAIWKAYVNFVKQEKVKVLEMKGTEINNLDMLA